MITVKQTKLYRQHKGAIRGNHARIYKVDDAGLVTFVRHLFLWPLREKINQQKGKSCLRNHLVRKLGKRTSKLRLPQANRLSKQ